MKNLRKHLPPSELPAPIVLTPEQLAAVASDTGAALGGGLGLPIIHAGPMPLDPVVAMTASLAITAV